MFRFYQKLFMTLIISTVGTTIPLDIYPKIKDIVNDIEQTKYTRLLMNLYFKKSKDIISAHNIGAGADIDFDTLRKYEDKIKIKLIYECIGTLLTSIATGVDTHKMTDGITVLEISIE